MSNTTRRFTAGIALLLIGLSLILAVNLTAPLTARANPGVLYAAPTAQGSGDCSSWANACMLQNALEWAQSGDEIWVQAGVYYPGKASVREATFALKDGVAVYGGFAGTETSRDERDWQTNLTILSGDIDQNDINDDKNDIAETWNDIVGDNAYHVVTGSGTDSSAVLDGFVITAGQANGYWPDDYGGGMFNESGSPTLTNVTFSGNSASYSGGGMYNESGSPTLTNVAFSGNSASYYGGGIDNVESSPRLTNVTFSGNSADGGGGMFNTYGSPTLTNVTFSGNSADGGGGMFNKSSYPALTNVTFSGNSASQYGGGMYNGDSSPVLTNVTCSDNRASQNGGGMYNESSSSPVLTNVTFSGNQASQNGGGMYNTDSSPTLTNVIIWGNTAANGPSIYNDNSTPPIAYSDIEGCGGSGSWNSACGTNGGGNIDADPRFVDAVNGNLRLLSISPAVDAGNNAAVPSGIVTDLDGNPRFVDIPFVPDTGNGTPPIVDMGAYEAQDDTPPTVLSILRADPNPTNAASVRFAVAFSEAVQNVDVSDFTLTTTGISGASLTAISGGGATYTVTVSTGSGDGTLRLDIPDTAAIADLAGIPLSGLPYTGGETYTIDRSAPTVLSILRADPNPTNAASVRFAVAFSEAVQSVDASDFTLTTTGVSGAGVTGVSGAGGTYTVTVATGAGSGTLRLDVPATASITDPAGNLLSGLPYTDGEVYEVKAERVRYAAPTAQGSGNCTSWANACTLQTALAQAVSGDEIWVKAGVHYPTTKPYDRTATFTLKNGVAVYGGFAGTETSRDQRNWQANKTILSGDIDRNDITDPNGVVTTTAHITGTNAYRVVTGSGTGNTAVLDGFTITAGQANDFPYACGGGMYNYGGSPTLTNVAFSGNSAIYGGGMYNYGGSPTLTNVTFSGNSASYSGGGMYNYGGSPTLTNVTFSGNSASSGGGMYNEGGSPTLTNVTFSGNSASYHGGGMYNEGGNPTLTNVAFSGNSAGGDGGGMYNVHSSPMLTNVTFSGNSTSYYGGGMGNSNSSPTLTNVTFSGNSASCGGGMSNYNGSPTLTNVTFSGNSASYGGGMYNYESSPTLTNVIIWGNTADNGGQSIYNWGSTPSIAYSDIQGCGGSGSWNSNCGADGGGNIDADPLFVDAANGNLRLQLNSPAIDAGNNAAVPSGIVTDLDGNPRFVDIPTVPDTGNGTPPIVDMGAYEAQYVDVVLDKAVLPSMVAPGDVIAFALTLSYTGTIPASDVVITDTLPAWLWGESFTSTLSVADTGYLPPYVWRVQNLAPGQSGVITVSGVLTLPLAAGTYTNTAFISAMGDLLAENNTAVITFTVPNLAPVFTGAPVVTATQGAPYTYTATAGDDNGDRLTITAPTLPAWLTLLDHGDGTATLAGTPSNANVGDHPVLLRVTDSRGAFTEQEFVITVSEKPRCYVYIPLVFRNWRP